MRFRNRQRALSTFAVAATLELFACSPALAGAPTERLREFFTRVDAVLVDPATEDRPAERVARIRRLVGDIGDVDAAAAAALGPEWETKSAAERHEFVALFADVLERAYVARFAGAVRAGGLGMSYRDEVITGSDATVTAALRGRGGHDVRVEYRMTVRDGRWRVRDIVLDGVSTVENYRAQFRRLLQHGSYLTLVAQMRDKLTTESLMFARSERPSPAPTPAPAEPPIVVAAAPLEPPPVAPPAPVAAPARPVVKRDHPVARLVSRPVRVERVTRPATAPLVAAVTSPLAAPSPPRPPAPPLAESTPAVAEPSALGTVLGGVVLGLLGVAGATIVRRRSSSKS